MVRGLIRLLPVFKFGVRKVAWMVEPEECKVSGAVVDVVMMSSVEMSSERVKVELVFGNFEGDDKGEKEPFVRNVLPYPRVKWEFELVVSEYRLLGNGGAVHL